jgi:serine protease Do
VSSTLQRLLLWLVIVGSIYAIQALFSLDVDRFEEPRRPLPPGTEAWSSRTPAAPPAGRTPTEPLYEMWVEENGEVGDSIGTAFLVGPQTWITAGHVLESCASAYVRIQGRWRPFTRFAIHPVADVAVGTTDAPEKPPQIELTGRLPVLNQEGYHFGYPQGRPTSVYTRFVGMARIRQGRPGTPIEQGWVWAEQERAPSGLGPLGGISGGPQVDRTGAVQGITVLHSERSARLTTTPVFRAREVLPEGFPVVAAGPTSIDRIDYASQGARVRDTGAVSLVFCSVSGRTRPRS